MTDIAEQARQLLGRLADRVPAEVYAEAAALAEACAVELAYRTRGGTPPGYRPWANIAAGPPSTANDPNAPPLRRGLT